MSCRECSGAPQALVLASVAPWSCAWQASGEPGGGGVQVGTKNGSGAASASPSSITLLHLLLVAIVAYILGVYLR